MVSVKDISYGYHDDSLLFEDVSFKIQRGDRLVIVGENGAGKSTLLKIVAGILQPEDGFIHIESGVRMLYVLQEFDGHHETVRDYILRHTKKIGPALVLAEKFGFNTVKYPIETTICRNLSGGQQKAIMLSVAFAEEPSVLLLDEPENHLDIVARKHLLDCIRTFSGAIVLISHDQTTLTTVVNRTIELIDKAMYLTEGGYHEYIKARARRVESAERERKTLAKDITELQKSLVIMHQKAFRGKATGDYRARKAEIAEMKDTLKNTNAPSAGQSKKLGTRIASENRSDGRFIWESTGLQYRYPGDNHDTFRSESLEIRFGDRVGLVGRNGAGKSTLLGVITEKLQPTGGMMRRAPDITWEIFNQHMHLPEDGIVSEVVREDRGCSAEDAFRILGSAKLSGKQFSALRVRDLSGGQRMRLRFALAFSRPLDLIILDEPTNNLDESTLEILEKLINEFDGAVLIITHDRAFMEQLELHKFWVVSNHTVSETYRDLADILKELERVKV